jgi:aspartate-semialdehyde dehydrogenase
MRKPNIAIAGATGLVGRTMLKVLSERNVEWGSLKLLASARSAGNVISHQGVDYTIEELTDESFEGVDLALFSCGGDTSRRFAKSAVKAGAYVIDNSSAWRMDSDTPLVVPEVNSDYIPDKPGIIANPNCSTIQMVVALKPISSLFGLNKVICSTYQSISGAGQKGVDKLASEIDDQELNKGGRIAYSALFHTYQSDGRTDEENKMINETRKIMSLEGLDISVTCVRLPIIGGHAESLWIETEKPVDLDKLKSKLNRTSGIIFSDNFENGEYPTPESADGRDPVFVARVKKDEVFGDKGLSMWVVADNLRKGAATNAVQIAERIIESGYVS